MTVFGARVRFVTDAGKHPDISPIGKTGTWRPDSPGSRLGEVKLDRPVMFLGELVLSYVRASLNDLEECDD